MNMIFLLLIFPTVFIASTLVLENTPNEKEPKEFIVLESASCAYMVIFSLICIFYSLGAYYLILAFFLFICTVLVIKRFRENTKLVSNFRRIARWGINLTLAYFIGLPVYYAVFFIFKKWF